MNHSSNRPIVVLNFESQTGHLFARRVRDLGYAAEVVPYTTRAEQLQHSAGIVLSGGRHSVYDSDSPQVDYRIWDLPVPILGLCYGLHLMAQDLGGRVQRGEKQEYGLTTVSIHDWANPLFADLPDQIRVVMSHGDEVTHLPSGYIRLASSDHCTNAAFADVRRNRFALQWHPEASHSEGGQAIIAAFAQLCRPSAWSVADYLPELEAAIKQEVGNRAVLVLFSGGVDSLVTATLLRRVLGPERVWCVFVDTGLLRIDERQEVEDRLYRHGIVNAHTIDVIATVRERLTGVVDPENKRRIIGDVFPEVREHMGEKLSTLFGDQWVLAQGTIYPDTVETGRVKTHHNRSPAMQALIEQGRVIEPLRELYKDEVRRLGAQLGLPAADIGRHPFPGPGYAVRILCANEPTLVTEYEPIDLPHAVLPVRSVGVQGDGRSYRHAVLLFSPDPLRLPAEYWEAATCIPNTRPQFNRVTACLSHDTPFIPVFTPGCLTAERIALLQRAEALVITQIRRAGLYDQIWQFPVVLLPCGSKAGGQAIVLRPVTSEDAMTAQPFRLPRELLGHITEGLLALGVDVVAYDLTPKPPGTIKWE